MATPTAADLERALRSMRYWDGQAGEHATLAEEMRTTAWQLDSSVASLDRVLSPVRDLHIRTTWEGTAATKSRLRLDAHEDRCTSAIQTIHHLIDDLRDEAAIESQRADDARDRQRDYRLTAGRIEVELEALDDAYR